MSYRRMMYISLLLLFFTMAGCAGLSSVGGASPEEMKKAEMTKDDLWNQTKALEQEKADNQQRLADQQEELTRMAKDLSDQQTEIAQANKQVADLNKSVDELNVQMRQLQEARQREHPLKETELVQPKKETAKPVKKIRSPKSVAQKASPEVNEREPKATDTSAILKQITEAKQQLAVGKEEPEKPQRKKEAETQREKITEPKQEVQPGASVQKLREPRPIDDLSLQMKQFGEAEEKETAAREAGSAQVKKGMAREDKAVKAPKHIARKEPAEMHAAQKKALKIKVLAGDGNIASARSLSKRMGKMGYRIKLIDRAPRSDFDTTVVYYGNEYRAAAVAMAKRLGEGTATKPLTWSSDFDIIIVTGHQP